MNILLHICCANCAIYPVKTLQEEGHNLTGFWFNPNIHPYQEYELRLNSVKDLAGRWRIGMIYTSEYEPAEFFRMFNATVTHIPRDTDSSNDYETLIPPPPPLLKGDEEGFLLKSFPQHPERCKSCYRLRLEKTAEQAQKKGFDAFSTTLLISPFQDFEQLVIIGEELAGKYNVPFYLRDFRQYFCKAMTYAKEFGLYRQKYCGCIYSRKERYQKKTTMAKKS